MFDFLKNMKDMGPMIQKAMEMQENLKKAQDRISQKIVEAESGGGMVRVRVSGKLEVKEVALDAKLIALADKKMTEDLVLAAVNQAIQRAQDMMAQELKEISSQMGPLGALMGKS